MYFYIFLFFLFQFITADEELFVDQLRASINIDESIVKDLKSLCSKTTSYKTQHVVSTADLPLFKEYPILQQTIPHISLGSLPTPVHHCSVIEQLLPVEKLYIKCDDKTGKILADGSYLFGGNKVRKLEFVLADALEKGVDIVMTFGCVGSNHVAATVTYAWQVGLRCTALLKPQPGNSKVSQRNLLLDYFYGTKMIHAPTYQLRSIAAINEFVKIKEETGMFPYVIPTGASCPIGAIGFVNAAFELQEQINAGLLPEPDVIYVPLGSAGTVAGLLLGIEAAGLQSIIHAIAVEPAASGAFLKKIKTLFEQTNQLLHAADPHFPLLNFSTEHLVIDEQHCGKNYALFTNEGTAATVLLKSSENIMLDGVYSAKAFAALVYDAQQQRLKNKNVLFWHTFCGDSFELITNAFDYHQLPKAFHRYFEEPMQEEQIN